MIYLYGHVPAGASPPDAPGVADAAVQLAGCGSAAAVISEVPDQDFSAAAIEERMSDLEWIGRRGVEHERVVAHFVDQADILPARLFTLFSSREALEADCAERAEWLERRLHEFAGLREWDVKVGCDMDRFTQHAARHSEQLAAMDREVEQASAGRRYLLQRKRDELARGEARRVAEEIAAGLLARLGELARESRRLEPPRGAAADELPVVLNAAFLLEREREPDLAEAVRRRAAELEPQGFDVVFTGPWAPYRFIGGA